MQSSKKSGAARKKAIVQLKTFSEMLRDELNVPTDKLQHHVVWPRMDPLEQCKICKGSHPSLYEKPAACRQPGTQMRTQPEPPGFHLFKDNFDGDEFSKWIHSIVNDCSKAVEKDVFNCVLQFITRLSVGVFTMKQSGAFASWAKIRRGCFL